MLQGLRALFGRGPSIAPRNLPSEVSTRVHFDVLPASLFSRVAAEAAAFHRNSVEHTVEVGGQTTQWLDVSQSPRCAIEEAVGILQQIVLADGMTITGCEWWVQSRAQPAGMNLHLDTDMGLHHRANQVRCPEMSSVFYLTPSPSPTMILDQHLGLGMLGTPQLQPAEVERVDLVYPLPNQYATFAGNKVHGVLPTDAWHANSPLWYCENEVERTTLLVNYWTIDKPEAPCCVPTTSEFARQLEQAGNAATSSGTCEPIDAIPLAEGSLGIREVTLLDLEQSGEGVVSIDAEVVVAESVVLGTQFFVPNEHEWVAGVTTLKGMGRRRMVDNCYDQ